MNAKQINTLISQLKKIDFTHARIKIDDFELEIDRDGSEQIVDSDTEVITSPMIGILHQNEQPIKVGDVVDKTAVLGQIESMKLYNELVAGVEGQITKVLVADGAAVEFGQNLFEIELNEDI